jgi:protein-S-isoprenylcysteine O-methyltransferase Ste14
MISLVLRNLFFTILQPGMVAGLIPYWILGRKFSETFSGSFDHWQYAAIVLFVIGLAILLYCIGLFAVKGKGTLSPADETKSLVITGLYKYSRNPMYIGVTLMLVAEAIFFSSSSLWIYTAIVFICFNAFIILHEEPRLKRDFGAQYDQYRKSVRRWL